MSVNNDINWSQLVIAAMNNDSEAIEKLYNFTYAQAFSVAMQMVKNEQDAMDIMQDAYISAFGKLSSLKDPEKFKGWFNCIVANRCRDFLKKKKTIPFTDLDVAEDIEFEDTLENDNMDFSPDASVDYAETKRIVNEILQALPEEQRLCILMYYYNELTIKEIAETLECSESTVKSRLNYAKKKIKEDVQALEKKGTFLLGGAIVPFIVWMLKGMEANVTVTTVAPQIYAAAQGGAFVGSAVAGSAASTTATVGTTAATTGVAGTTAATTGTVVAGIGATKIGVVIAGVAAAAAISVGAAVGVSNHGQNNDVTPPVDVVVEAETEEDASVPEEEWIQVPEGYTAYVCEETAFGTNMAFFVKVSEDGNTISLQNPILETDTTFQLVDMCRLDIDAMGTHMHSDNAVLFEGGEDGIASYYKMKELKSHKVVEKYGHLEDVSEDLLEPEHLEIALFPGEGYLEFYSLGPTVLLEGTYYKVDQDKILKPTVDQSVDPGKRYICSETEIGSDTGLQVRFSYDKQNMYIVDDTSLLDIELFKTDFCWNMELESHTHPNDIEVYFSMEEPVQMYHKLKDSVYGHMVEYASMLEEFEEYDPIFVEIWYFPEENRLEYMGEEFFGFWDGTYYLVEE